MTTVTGERAAPALVRGPSSPVAPSRPRWVRFTFLAVLAAFVSLILASYAVPLWYQLQGDRLLVVTSGSMAPEIQAGDSIVIRQVTSASQLRLGQIITFYPTGSPKLVTHRIVGLANVVRVDGTGRPVLDGSGQPVRDPYVRTKGDANPVPDPNLTPSTSVRGIVREVHPGWGVPLAWAHSPTGRLMLFGPPLLMLAIAELMSRSHLSLADLARRLADAARPVMADAGGDTSGGADAPTRA